MNFRTALPFAVLSLCMALFARSDAYADGAPSLFTPSVRAFNSQYLDHETLTATTLESLLNERIKRVITAAGVHPGEFSSSVTVHVVKQLKPVKPSEEEASKTPAADLSKKSAPTVPDFSSFQDHSLLSADDLVNRFEKEERDQINTEAKPPLLPNESETFTYAVDHIYAQTALSEKFSADIRTQVEKAIHASLDPLYPDHIKVDVNSFASFEIPWYKKILPWLQKLQYLALAALLVMGAIFFLVLSRLVPSWQARQALRTAHEEDKKEQHIAAEAQDEEIEEDGQPTDEEISEEELPPVAEPAPALEEEKLLAEKVIQVKDDILTFLRTHLSIAPVVIADWGVKEESLSKISLTVELLSRDGLDIGRVELRNDQFNALREYKRKGEELALKEQVRLYNEIFWDFVSAKHLAQETGPHPFDFLNITDDGILLEAIRTENSQVKAQVMTAITAKRAAILLSKLPIEQTQEVMENLFSGAQVDQKEVPVLASRLQERVHSITSSRNGVADRGVETLITILKTMDFSAQFKTARGFLDLDSSSRDTIIASFFNVALLPIANTAFLERVFLDKPTDQIRAVLSQFDSDFSARVQDLLPPLQKRMLESRSVDSISAGTAMTALKELNDMVLDEIAKGKINIADIFEKDPENNQYSGAEDEAQVA